MPSASKLGTDVALKTLKLDALRHLARQNGLSSSASKAVLLASFESYVKQSRLPLPRGPTSGKSTAFAPNGELRRTGSNGQDEHNRPYRILSMDMGIRNLAFCLLELDRDWVTKTKSPDSVRPSTARPSTRVLQWRRLALVGDNPFSNLATVRNDHKGASFGDAQPQEHLDLTTLPESATQLASDESSLWKPPHMASLAWQILSSLVVFPRAYGNASSPQSAQSEDFTRAGPPDLILIEKQRWRSGGASAVQEWTLRVNSLEAMLWSGLEVLRQLGVWEGSVHAVDPKRAMRFWLPNLTPSTEKLAKTLKIDLVRDWIANGQQVQDQDESRPRLDWTGLQARSMRDAFMSTSTRKKKNTKIPSSNKAETTAAGAAVTDACYVSTGPETELELELKTDVVKKRDDLADCLLQGLAWIAWEQNRRALLQRISSDSDSASASASATSSASSSSSSLPSSPPSSSQSGKQQKSRRTIKTEKTEKTDK